MVKRYQVKNFKKGFNDKGRFKGKNYPPKFSKPGAYKNKNRRNRRRRSVSPRRRNKRYSENPKTKFRRRRRSFDRGERRPKLTDEERKTQIFDKLDDQLDKYWIKGKKEDKIQENLDNQLDVYFSKDKKNVSSEETKSEQHSIANSYSEPLSMNQIQYQPQLTDPNLMYQMPNPNMYGDLNSQTMNPMSSMIPGLDAGY